MEGVGYFSLNSVKLCQNWLCSLNLQRPFLPLSSKTSIRFIYFLEGTHAHVPGSM